MQNVLFLFFRVSSRHYISKMLEFRKFEEISEKTYMKQIETTVLPQIFCMQYYKNYSQLTFYYCFL